MPVLQHLTLARLTPLFIMGIRITMMAAKFALAIFLARYMGLEELGLYGLIVAAVSVIPVIFKFGTYGILNRDAVTQTPGQLAHSLYHYYAGVSGLYLLLLPFVAVASILMGHSYIPLLVFVLVVIEHVVIDWFALFVSLKRPIRANMVLFIQSGGWPLAFMVCAWLIPDLRNITALLLFWIGGGMLAVLSAIGVWTSLPWRETFRKGFDLSWFKEMWKRSRLFYVSELANAGTINIDRYLVGIFLGLEATGIYVLFWQMANAVHSLVSTGILQLKRTQLIATYANDTLEAFIALHKAGMKHTALSVTGLAASAAAVAPLVLRWTEKPEAIAYMPLLWIMLFAMILRALTDCAGNALMASYRDKVLVGSSLCIVAAMPVMLTAGINLFGLYGAAASLAITYLGSLLYRQSVISSMSKA